MSEESTTPDLINRTRQVFDAASRQDRDAVLSFLAPDAVMDLSDGGLGTFRDIAAVGGFLEEWFGTWNSSQVDPEEVAAYLGPGQARAAAERLAEE